MDHSKDRVWVWIDLSSSCNLSCRDCYTKQAHAPALLSLKSFERILGKLAAADVEIEKLHLNWRGEPLTNKHFIEFLRVRRAMAPTVPLEFHTNGLLLTTTMCKGIVEQSMEGDLAYVSIDGGGQVLHEANRGPGTWYATMDGLRQLLDARDAGMPQRLSVGIYEISYGRATTYDRELVALSRRCDIWMRVCPIDRHGHEMPFETAAVPMGPCFWAGNSMCITAKGDVHVCMLSFDDRGVIGNILEDDPRAIIERGRSFREALTSLGRGSVPHCRNCRKTEGAIDT